MTQHDPQRSTDLEQTPAELLTKALEHLAPSERQRVTAWCLSRMSGVSYAGWVGRQERADLLKTLPQEAPELHALYSEPFSGGGLGTGGDHHVVPVRLPDELYGRLRRWSTDNGFSMATVVRGLVTRFLDGQAVRAATEPVPAERTS